MESQSTIQNNKTTGTKKPQCPFCGKDNLRLITNQVRFGKKADVYQCLGCELTFLDQGSFHFPKDFYEQDYHQTYLTHVEPDALNPQVYFEKMKKTTQPWADKLAKSLTGKEIVLDIGCSTGHFMDLIKDKVGQVYGCELNKKEIEFCQKVLKFDVSDEPLEKRFKEGMFDYITLIYVLEHIGEPKEFLNSIKRFLKPSGKIIILVPNIQDALVNFYQIPEFQNFYYCIEHLYYYNPKTIKNLLDQVGLAGTIEVVQEYPITNHLNWGYRRAPSDTLAARRGVPDIALLPQSPEEAWQQLWQKFNAMYREFLKTNGYGDRVWCSVGK